jgi:hypothetical protein
MEKTNLQPPPPNHHESCASGEDVQPPEGGIAGGAVAERGAEDKVHTGQSARAGQRRQDGKTARVSAFGTSGALPGGAQSSRNRRDQEQTHPDVQQDDAGHHAAHRIMRRADEIERARREQDQADRERSAHTN